MSNTFYEAAGQNWFTLDSVHIHYNWTQEATFNASEVYAPATSSYHCQHVSSLHKYDTLLVPSSHTDTSANWHITFTDFQVHLSTKELQLSFFLPFPDISALVCMSMCGRQPFSFMPHLFGSWSNSPFVYRLFGSPSVCLFPVFVSHLLGCFKLSICVPRKPVVLFSLG